MQINNISVVIANEKMLEYETHLQKMIDEFSLIQTVFTDKQVQGFYKGGARSLEEAKHLYNLIGSDTSAPKFAVNYFDAGEYVKDYKLFENLSRLKAQVASLMGIISRTRWVAGDDMLRGLSIYKSTLRTAKKSGQAEAIGLYDTYFLRKRKSTKNNPDDPNGDKSKKKSANAAVATSTDVSR